MKRACVIGWPIEHSRSPLIHESWLKQYGIEGAYTKEAVKPGKVADFLSTLTERGFAGCNVTIPHKEATFNAADVRYPEAEAVGAANTVWIEDGKLHATNTDTYGFMAYLNAKAPSWAAGDPKVVVLGAGGAARAIVFGLLEAGQKNILLINRTEARARDLCAHFGNRAHVASWEERTTALKGAGLVINTTSLGMVGKGALDIDLAGVNPDCVVSDIVYAPLETALLKAASARGLKTVDGLGMLLHQAVPAFEKWFGVRPEVTPDLYQRVAEDVRKSLC